MPTVQMRARAFQARGLTLKFPAHSWSGIRADDGAVVFAIAGSEVRVDQRGYCCLLWSPGRRGAQGTMERASIEERREHCRLALRHGRAEGFLLDERLETEGDTLLELRIVLSGEKYWARWGAGVLPSRPDERSLSTEAA